MSRITITHDTTKKTHAIEALINIKEGKRENPLDDVKKKLSDV